MPIRYVSLLFVVLAFICMPVWPHSKPWGIVACPLCFIVAGALLLVSIFGRSQGEIFKGRGHH